MKPTRVEQLAEEARHLSGKLGPLIAELNAVIKDGALRSAQNQLEAVVKSIKSLEKVGVPVPSELAARHLDLEKRVRTLDVAEQAMAQIAEFLHTMPRSMQNRRNPQNSCRKHRTDHGSVSLRDLFEVGLLLGEETLIFEKKRSNHIITARLRKPGLIELTLNGRTEVFDNPSAAGALAAGTQTFSGWTRWFVQHDDGHRTVLDEYRRQFLRTRNND